MALLERRKLTYEDYLSFPEDGRRHELIDGEHCVTPAPVGRHQWVVMQLSRAFLDWLDRGGPGQMMASPFDVVLSEWDIVQPDLLWIASSVPALAKSPNLPGPPDLAVEVLSPTSRKADEEIKLKLYESYGVAEYWLVDPDAAQVTIWRREGRVFGAPLTLAADAGSILSSPLLPGFTIPVEKLFP